ncbi:MAG: phosphatidate phosphatase APP1 [Marivirga sp.]
MEDRPEFFAEVQDRKRKNIKTMLSRYFSTPLPETEVDIWLKGKCYTTHCDELGYFSIWINTEVDFDAGWHTAAFIIKDDEQQQICRTEGDFLIADNNSDFGVISDIDDTVLVSHATQIVRKTRLILTKNAKTRLPFEGVAEFYQLLSKNGSRPLFYVSSSEWNLYDFLVDFFTVRGIPKGPFLLQEFKSGLNDLLFSGGGSHFHKLQKIRRLMDLFPHMSFILIGDSGQRDLMIYHKALIEFHTRIKAVYIRKIKKQDAIDLQIQNDFRRYQVPLLLIKNTEEAEVHAKNEGWI